MNHDDELWILVIDDEEQFRRMMIEMLERNLPNVHTAESSNGADGLEAMKNESFDCVILDYKMPQKNGLQVLKEVREAGIETPIIMLTGFGDEHLAVDLMKAGASDYLPKNDLTPDAISRAVRGAIALRKSELRRVAAEKELLEKTLIGAVTTLIDMLGLVNPVALTRAARIKRYVHMMTSRLDMPDAWQYELAAILSQVGYVLIPPDLLNKHYEDAKLSEDELKMLSAPPSVASTLISKIPRLESIAQIIEAQQRPYHGETAKELMRGEETAALGGYILNVAIEFDRLREQGLERDAILEQLQLRHVTHDPDLLEALGSLHVDASDIKVKSVGAHELKVGMELNDDVFTSDGILLASKGQEVTYPMLRRLHTFADGVGILEPIWIKAPPADK
ncbi:MAG: response regulator [Fidelibacterota bacterium]|nr:MAG: response regulator [Candidatus Neomarinimicrobiota bacterium]